ncbi:MAG: IdeS/Mac family cysteine endopeptidase, partial [Alistipes sp.]|nr:IdeS/Mac family cysteine endopeptidase [Alistipes sp.]
MKKILFALAALLGIVACENEPAVEVQQTLTLSADKVDIVADGEDVATFTVKNSNDEVAEATIYFEETNEALEGNTFKTKYTGEYKFYAKNGNNKSNTLTINAIEKGNTPEPEPEPDTLQLSVDKQTINADGVQKATFTAAVNGEVVAATIYNAANDTALAGNTFSTTEAGDYRFYAKYNDLVSDIVKVTAISTEPEEEKPITIEATVNTIKANGIDYTMLIVTQDGANVTNKSTIYANGAVVNGNKFATTTPGTYTIYATKGTVTSNEITITATEVEGGNSIVFAEGVDIASGWYDVNKKGAGDNGDINMCWAAASANMIQWWQDRYV